MRKMTFKRDEEKLKKRNQLVLGIILIFIMFSSTLGYAFQSFLGGSTASDSEEGVVKFNGFDFKQQNGFWVLDFNGENLLFSYSPSELLGVAGEVKNVNNYGLRPLYIYSESVAAESEIRTNMFGFADGIGNACPEGTSSCSEEVKTCEDNFVIIREAESDGITQDRNCVFIEGKKEDLVKLADEFLYKTLGVA